MVQTPDVVLRDFVTDGVPASGKWQPPKSGMREMLNYLFGLYSAAQAGGGLAYATKADMTADLAHGANQIAWVMEDPTAANNGIYQFDGSGSWNRLGDLPYSFIVASDVGEGTPNAIVATSSLPISSSALVLLNVYEENTGSPVTVSFNGGSPLTIKTNSGNDVAPGGLVSGMLVLGRVSGSTFRLVSDQVPSAIVAQAEAAAAQAVAAAAGLNLPSITASDVGKTLVVNSDGTGYDVLLIAAGNFAASRTALKSMNPLQYPFIYLGEAGREGTFQRKSGAAPADTYEGIYVPSDTAGYYYERVVSGKVYNASWWGVIGDDSTDCADRIQAAANVGVSGLVVILPAGTIRVGSTINITGGYRTIVGQGSATTIRRTFAAGHLFLAQNAAGSSMNDLNIGNFRIDSTVTVTSGGQITIQKGAYCTVHRVTISGGFHGIWLLGGFEVRVKDVSVTYASGTTGGRSGFIIERSGVDYGSEHGGNFYLDNCSADGGGQSASAGASSGLKISAADGVFVNNCYFGYFSSASASLDNSTTGYLTGVCFTNTWFDHAVSVGVLMSGSTGTNFTNIKFVACTFWGGGTATKNLWIAGNPANVMVVACRMGGGVSEQNIFVEGTAYFVKISDTHCGQSTGDGIYILGGTRCSVQGCDVQGGSGAQNGIRIANGNVCKATDNEVSSFVNGILTSGTLNNYIVADNTLFGNTTKVSDGASGATKFVGNNI